MKLKNSVIKRLNVDTLNKGKIIKRDEEYYIVMENHLHTFPDKEIIDKYENKVGDEIYDEFLINFQHEHSYQEIQSLHQKDILWTIIMEIPIKLTKDNEGNFHEVGFSIKYDSNLKIYYILLIGYDSDYYKIYDFMEADYTIYEDKYPEGFYVSGGNHYLKKTGYTLNSFYERYSEPLNKLV